MIAAGRRVPVRDQREEPAAGNEAQRRQRTHRGLVPEVLRQAPAPDLHRVGRRVVQFHEVVVHDDAVGAQPFVEADACTAGRGARRPVGCPGRRQSQTPRAADPGKGAPGDLRTECQGVQHRAARCPQPQGLARAAQRKAQLTGVQHQEAAGRQRSPRRKRIPRRQQVIVRKRAPVQHRRGRAPVPHLHVVNSGRRRRHDLVQRHCRHTGHHREAHHGGRLLPEPGIALPEHLQLVRPARQTGQGQRRADRDLGTLGPAVETVTIVREAPCPCRLTSRREAPARPHGQRHLRGPCHARRRGLHAQPTSCQVGPDVAAQRPGPHGR